MNILAIGAHFDDIELGCGGALAKHVLNGDNAVGFVATSSEFCNREGNTVRDSNQALEEALRASEKIGYQLLVGNIPTFHLEYGEEVNAKLLKIIEENRIDLIYTHWNHDVHHDHRNLALSTMHVARHVNRVLMYRSNWYSSEEPFWGNFYVDITGTWEIKEEAIRAYESEYKRVGEKWLTFFRQDALNNGLKAGVEFAEAFQVVKWMM